MDFLISVLLLLFSYAILRHRFLRSRTPNLPPGPTPLPIVGNLFKLGSRPHQSLANLAKIHGPVISLKLGGLTTIVISSPSAAKEALQKNDALFCNRNILDSVTACQHHEFSVVFLPVAAQWRSLRKICNSHVFATCRLDSTQYLRKKKLDDLLCYVRNQSGAPIDIGKAAFVTTLNLMSNTFFSVDLVDPNSSNSDEFKELVWQIMAEAGKPNLSDYFPLVKRLDPQGIKRRLETHFRKLLNLFDGVITQRLAERKGCLDESNDILDTLLKISQDNSQELHHLSIQHLLQDLFTAGTETTSSTIEWAMAELLCNPNKMSKAKEELENFVGKGIELKEEDIGKLPYLQCVIKETLRLHPPSPFLVPRKTNSDVELCGFVVPKDSQVLVNVWAMGRDPTLWENSNSFKPERFLGLDVDVKGQDFELIPFGAGRRICPGLPLAMRMLPLMLGSLVNCFQWKLEDGIRPDIMDMNDKFGFALQKDHPLLAIPTPNI